MIDLDKKTLSLVSVLCLFVLACTKEERIVRDNKMSTVSSVDKSGVRIIDGVLAFESMDSLNYYLDNYNVLKNRLADFDEFESFFGEVDQIFESLDDLKINDASYFDQPDLAPYVKFIVEFGEPSLVPTIYSPAISSVFNKDLEIIIGSELLKFDGKSKVRHYKISDISKLQERRFIKDREVQVIESQPTLARGNQDECRENYHDHNERRVVGKVATTNIFGGYRNDFTIKNQKKRWYGWTDYKADRLELEGEITYNIDVCVDVDGNPNTACQWINNYYTNLSCSVSRTWYDTRRETANCSVIPPNGVGHEDHRPRIVGWDASYTVFDSPSTNWRATCTCIN